MQEKTNREAWLTEAVSLITPVFESAGYPVPACRVSTGWPSQKALSTKNRRLGEMWPGDTATDGKPSVFISPFLDDIAGPIGVLSILTHELVHVAVGAEAMHGPKFKKCALKVGLEGKMTSTTAGDRLLSDIKVWSEKLGPYPHARLDLTKAPAKKKQSTRMVKCTCAECNYTLRTTRKWIDVAVPKCPVDGAQMEYELPDADDSEGGEE